MKSEERKGGRGELGEENEREILGRVVRSVGGKKGEKGESERERESERGTDNHKSNLVDWNMKCVWREKMKLQQKLLL